MSRLIPSLVFALAVCASLFGLPVLFDGIDDRVAEIEAELVVSARSIAEGRAALDEAAAANERARRLLAGLATEPIEPPPVEPPPVRPPVDPPDRPARMTCEELRALVVDVDRSRWTVLEPPTPSFGRITVPSVSAEPPGQVWENMVWRGGYEGALVIYGASPGVDVLGHVRQRAMIEPRAIVPGVWVRDGVDQFGKMKWGLRAYRQRHGKLLYVYGNGGWTRQHGPATSEHFDYESPNGGMEFGFLVVEGWGGQAIQVASRPPAGPGNGAPHNNAFAGGERIWVHDVCFHDNGTHSRRASFPMTMAFNNQADGPDDAHLADFTIERFHIRAAFEPGDRDEQGDQLRAHGAVLCSGGEAPGWRYGDVVIRDGWIELRDTDRPALLLGNCRTILVEDIRWSMEGGNLQIDLDGFQDLQPSKGPRGAFSGEIRWRGSTMEGAESLDIRVRGQSVGSGDEDMVIRAGIRISWAWEEGRRAA